MAMLRHGLQTDMFWTNSKWRLHRNAILICQKFARVDALLELGSGDFCNIECIVSGSAGVSKGSNGFVFCDSETKGVDCNPTYPCSPPLFVLDNSLVNAVPTQPWFIA
jgi:hypothetical protein